MPTTTTFRRGQIIKAPGGQAYAVTRTSGEFVWISWTCVAGQSHRTTQAELTRLGYRVVAS